MKKEMKVEIKRNEETKRIEKVILSVGFSRVAIKPTFGVNKDGTINKRVYAQWFQLLEEIEALNQESK